jgi:dipeptidyl aminopeptidase/acylaminoacyl peptidase
MPERLVGGENAGDISVSRTGNRLIYGRSLFDTNIWRIPGPNSRGKNSAPALFVSSTKQELEPQFSPDGKKIVFISARSGDNALWLCDHDGLNPVQLTSSDISVGAARWSPDSRQIVFISTKAGNFDIYMISAEGGPVRRLTTGPSDSGLPSWSRDQRSLYFGSNRTGDWQIWKMPAQGGTAVQVTKKGGAQAFESFDGNFVYYTKHGAAGIWKVPAAGGEEIQVLDEGGIGVWSLTDQGIYFGDMKDAVAGNGVVRHSHEPAVIKFYRFATRRLETVTKFPTSTDILVSTAAFSVSPDGQWIIYTRVDQGGSDLMLVENYR